MFEPPTQQERREAAKLAEAVYLEKTGRKLSYKRSPSNPDAFGRHYLQITYDMSAGSQFWRILLCNLLLIWGLFLVSSVFQFVDDLESNTRLFGRHGFSKWLPELLFGTVWWSILAIPFSFVVMRMWRGFTIGEGYYLLALLGLFVVAGLSSVATAFLTDHTVGSALVYWIGWSILMLAYCMRMGSVLDKD